MGPDGREDPGAALRIHRGSEVPPRRQIAMRLEARIRDGDWDAGARLPSVRALGERLGVHRDTVAAAYRELERQGMVRPVPGSGVYVSTEEPIVSRALGSGGGALSMRLASLSVAIRFRRLLLFCDERAFGEVLARELTLAIPGVVTRCEPAPARPCPGVHFGWLPIDVRTSRSAVSPTAPETDGGPSLQPVPLHAGLSDFDMKVLATQRFPAVVGVLSASAEVRRLVREAVRGAAGPEIGVVSAAPDEGPALRRLRARATILTWDVFTAKGAPRIPGRRHLLLRLVPPRLVSELHGLLGDEHVAQRRWNEGPDRVCEGPAGAPRAVPESLDRVDRHAVSNGDPRPAVRER